MGELIFKVLSTPYILRYFPLMRQKKCLRTQQSAVCSLLWGFPSGSGSKESVCNARDPGLIPGSGRSPGEGTGFPLWYPCLRSLAGYSPWARRVGHNRSDWACMHAYGTKEVFSNFLLVDWIYPPQVTEHRWNKIQHNYLLQMRKNEAWRDLSTVIPKSVPLSSRTIFL